jgi:predicted SAM-dependent methyltransferase
MRIWDRIAGPYREVKRYLACRRAKKIVIGSGGISFPGWFSTSKETLDVCNRGSFARYWRRNSRWAFLAEHVWEHLEPDEARAATAHCFEFLMPRGRLRLAVPDGLHPDPEYVERVRPGGTGEGAADHKVLYTFRTMKGLLEETGFEVDLLEYWDEKRTFQFREWSSEDGHIRRSMRFDPRNQGGSLAYTSLIVDARKP